jgi:hypothetical protein
MSAAESREARETADGKLLTLRLQPGRCACSRAAATPLSCRGVETKDFLGLAGKSGELGCSDVTPYQVLHSSPAVAVTLVTRRQGPDAQALWSRPSRVEGREWARE